MLKILDAHKIKAIIEVFFLREKKLLFGQFGVHGAGPSLIVTTITTAQVTIIIIIMEEVIAIIVIIETDNVDRIFSWLTNMYHVIIILVRN